MCLDYGGFVQVTRMDHEEIRVLTDRSRNIKTVQSATLRIMKIFISPYNGSSIQQCTTIYKK